LFLISADDLFRLRQLAHGSQAAGADIDRAHNAVDFNAAALDIQHEAAARALLRERHIVAMHGLAFAYFTTTRHIPLPLYLIVGFVERPLKLPLIIKPSSDILQMFQSLFISFSFSNEKLTS
jgi:hypothetical protein